MEDVVRELSPKLLRTQSNSKPVVLMTCGIAGAGKSTLSKSILSAYPNFERLSADATIAARHGIYGVDYPPEKYEEFLEEASDECETRLVELLREGKKDLVLDRSFYSKEFREETKKLIEDNGGRWVFVYLRAKSKEFLWDRIQRRRQKGINADCAYEITREILDGYWDGFEAPAGEGDIVIKVG
ncbi:P-loop containing nucleoside triphosphate hydrolase protein [Daldinia caldariorum]|uniref:P-loop containing nucleoside triphosphate hydrolase protein n=1 Tax=Daldinia caldariorum TaxID=326644 RepID=UPI00200822E1|nr:P-loop containing nucleoside triphosphate hydrolase protein [Daldinia caldariorum]KAI1464915.1 P-loop containing nucleoside triphosphate hydrolase protein [Daldinia caldariorum]